MSLHWRENVEKKLSHYLIFSAEALTSLVERGSDSLWCAHLANSAQYFIIDQEKIIAKYLLRAGHRNISKFLD